MSEADDQFPDNHTGLITPAKLRTFTKYLLAAYNRVHMDDDDEGVGDLDPVSLGASQADANARAELLRAAMIAHMDSVGTPAVDGDHLASDPINRADLVAIPTLTGSSDLAACITLVEGLNAALVKHNTQPGIHFHDSVSTIGTPQYPLCHCSVNVSADMDGIGGVVYSSEVVNLSGGITVEDLTFPDPSFIVIPMTLPVEVASDERVILHSLRIVSDPLLGAGPFQLFLLEIGNDGMDVSIAIPLSGSIPLVDSTVTLGVTFVMSVASTPSAAPMSIDTPTTLGHVITDLNDLLASYLTHFEDA